MSTTSLICSALLLVLVAVGAEDFAGVKDAVQLASPDLVDQEQMAKFLSNLHQEKIFEGVSEQSKGLLGHSLPSLKSVADHAADHLVQTKQQYANLVAQLENLNDKMKTLDTNVHEATVKLAAETKIRNDATNAQAQIAHLQTMLAAEESRRLHLAGTVSALQHSELLIKGHIARALRSSQANIAEGTAAGLLVDATARLVDAGVASHAGEVSAHLQQLDAKLSAQIAELEAKEAKGRWRLADDAGTADYLDATH
jgi:predicted RNase H-like nuclease (RuvC/YqgF family)